MAVGTGIFRTPVGQSYNPARDIERSFDKTTALVTGAIEANTQRKNEQEAAFGQMYSNLGELESNLQENYAGIGQQMVDSTREFMKSHYKKGGRSTDPEFQATLGQMTGRIKASTSNADRNREMLKQSAELIKSDDAIVDKARALSDLYTKMNDPDFLISQNQFNPEEHLNQYVDPRKVFEGVWKNLPSTGEWGNQYTDASGNLRSTAVITNPLINKDAPVNSDGTVNVNMTPEFAQEVMSGRYGQRIIDQTSKIAKEKYSDMPSDVAFSMALKDGLSSVSGLNYKNTVLKNARDINKENQMMAKQNAMLDIAYAREARLAGKEDEADEINNRFKEFTTALSSGDVGFFGEYENQKAGISGIELVDLNEELKTEKEIAQKVPTKAEWSKIGKPERIKIIEALGVEDQIPSTLGVWDTNTDEAYNAVKSIIDQIPSGEVGLRYKVKTGTKEGDAVYETKELPVGNQTEMEFAFRTLENLRRSGKSMKPVTPVDKPEEIDLTQKDYWK
jgi:hypothetical protein